MLNRSIKLLGSLLVYLIDIIVKQIRHIVGMKNMGTCVILYYHVVTKEQRLLFGKQLDMILKRMRPLKTTELSMIETENHNIAITFDDGFRSVLQNAIPELETRRFPATIFISPECVGKAPSWPDIEEREKSNEVVMNIEELKNIDHSFISFGSHSNTHANLLRITEEESIVEIADSKRILEKMLETSITEFSFPFGAFNENHVNIAKDAGYKRVFSIVPDLITENTKENFVVGRVRVDPDDWPLEFRLKVYGAYRWLPFAFELKRKLRNIF